MHTCVRPSIHPFVRFVWLGYTKDPRPLSEAARAEALALFWDKSPPKQSTASCAVPTLGGQLLPTFRPTLVSRARHLDLVKVGTVQLGPPDFFFHFNSRSAVQLDGCVVGSLGWLGGLLSVDGFPVGYVVGCHIVACWLGRLVAGRLLACLLACLVSWRL